MAVLGLVAYVAASLAAAATMYLLLLMPQGLVFAGSHPIEFLGGVLMLAVFICIFALIPFGVALVVLRWLKRRDWPSYVIAGLLVAFAAQYGSSAAAQKAPALLLAVWPLTIGGGVAGLIYWLVYRLLSRRFLRPD
jgi:hypothetical protein